MRTYRTRPFLEDKIKNLAELKKIIKRLKVSGKKIVFTNGCFDILHYGHAKYLQEAKRKGDILVVGVNSDSSVKKIKGPRRPMVGVNDRLALLAALESVDYVIKFSEETPYKLISAIRPDLLVKGGDWNKKTIVGSDIVAGFGGRVETIKFVKGKSTSSLIKRIAKVY